MRDSVRRKAFIGAFSRFMNRSFDLKEGSPKEDLEKAIVGHIIDRVELVGIYEINHQ